jgi:hypothetical protein
VSLLSRQPALKKVAFVALVAIATSGCVTVAVPPKEIVEPVGIGLWKSEISAAGSNVEITLQTGASFTVDQLDRVSFGYNGPTNHTTLIIVIRNGTRLSYIVAPVARAGDPFPSGCHPAVGALLYDEPGAIVMRLTAPQGSDWLPFGIRFRKAPSANVRSPSPDLAPFYGLQPRLCLDDLGQVTFVDG